VTIDYIIIIISIKYKALSYIYAFCARC